MHSTWTNLAWNQLWQVTLVAALVALAARTFARERPHLAYWLWVLVLIKCLTPPVFSSPTGLFSWARMERETPTTTTVTLPSPAKERRAGGSPEQPGFAPSADPSEQTVELAVAPNVSSKGQVASSDATPPALERATTRRGWSPLLTWVWLLGSAAIFFYVAVKRMIFSGLVRKHCRPANDALAAQLGKLCKRLGVPCSVRLLVSSRPLGPVVFGMMRPTIVVPQSLLDRRSALQVEPILAHELIHIRRGDLVVGMFQALVQTCWWFHPLVWWANRATNQERERCCDEEVIASLSCEPAVYAQNLIDVLKLRRQLRPHFTPAMGAAEITTRRLQYIMSDEKTFRRRTPYVYWIVLAAIGALLLPGAALRLPADDQVKVSEALHHSERKQAKQVNREPQSRSEWPRPRGGADNTGVAAKLGGVDFALQWQFQAKTRSFSGSPVIAGGIVYAADDEGTVYAIRISDGKLRWKYQSEAGFVASPVIHGKQLFIGDEGGRFHCLSTRTGKPLWTYETEADIAATANFSGQRVLFASQDGTLFCLEKNRGKVLWKAELADQIRSAPTIVGNDVFVVGCDGKLHVFHLKTGQNIGTFDFGAPSGSTPAYREGAVAFGDHEGRLHLVDGKTMKRLWTTPLRNRTPIHGGTAFAKQVIVASGHRNGVIAFDRKTGRITWQWKGGWPNVPPVVAGELVFVGMSNGRIVALDLRTGKQIWKHEASGGISGSAAIGWGRLVFATERGMIYCFSPRPASARKSQTTEPARRDVATGQAKAAPAKAVADGGHGSHSHAAGGRAVPVTDRPKSSSDLVSLIDLATRYAELKDEHEDNSAKLSTTQRLFTKGYVTKLERDTHQRNVARTRIRLRVMSQMIDLAIQSTDAELKSWSKQRRIAETLFQAGELNQLKLQEIQRNQERVLHRLRMLRQIVVPAKKTNTSDPEHGDHSHSGKQDAKTKPTDDRRFVLKFKRGKWSEVMQWYATLTQRSLDYSLLPSQPFTYSSKQALTKAELFKVLDEGLRKQGFRLRQTKEVISIEKLNNSPKSTIRY